ncbi:MAG: helix-turn-helix domain-containing protein [Promethearchaeota archaeon]
MVDLSKFDDGLMFSPLQKDLMEVLEKNGPLTRSDLVKKLSSPRTTIYDNLTRLQNHNLIRKFSRPTNSRGRPLVFFKLVDPE